MKQYFYLLVALLALAALGYAAAFWGQNLESSNLPDMGLNTTVVGDPDIGTIDPALGPYLTNQELRIGEVAGLLAEQVEGDIIRLEYWIEAEIEVAQRRLR